MFLEAIIWYRHVIPNPPCKTGRLHEQRIYGRLGNHSWNLIGTCHLWPSEHGLLMASSTHQIILSHAIPRHPPTSPYCWLHFLGQSISYPPINIPKDVENPPWVDHFLRNHRFSMGFPWVSHGFTQGNYQPTGGLWPGSTFHGTPCGDPTRPKPCPWPSPFHLLPLGLRRSLEIVGIIL